MITVVVYGAKGCPSTETRQAHVLLPGSLPGRLERLTKPGVDLPRPCRPSRRLAPLAPPLLARWFC